MTQATGIVPRNNYVYAATLLKPHDGDTFKLDIDLGVDTHRFLWVRLRGIDTWELSQPEGPSARDFADVAMVNAQDLTVKTHKTSSGEDDQSFARYVCDVWCDGVALSDLLRAAGYEKH